MGETQYQIILAIKILWSTPSNPLERLVDNAPNLFPLSTSFLCSFLTLLASNDENNIFSRISIDLEKVSYQSNHTVDCIFFEEFRKAWKYAGSSITSFIIFSFFISACLNTWKNLSISIQQVKCKQISKKICIHFDNFGRNIF